MTGILAMLGLWKARAVAAIGAPILQALSLALVAGVVMIGIGVAVHELRDDARRDERAVCTANMQQARIAQLLLRNRLRSQAEYMAQQSATEHAQELAISEAGRRQAEEALERLRPSPMQKARTVCYPKEIIEALNK